MIEIIFVLIFFSLIGYLITTIAGYVYIALFCLAILLASIAVGALVICFSCKFASAALFAASADISRRDKELKNRERKQLSLDERLALRDSRETGIAYQHPPPQQQQPNTIIQIAVTPDGVETRKRE